MLESVALGTFPSAEVCRTQGFFWKHGTRQRHTPKFQTVEHEHFRAVRAFIETSQYKIKSVEAQRTVLEVCMASVEAQSKEALLAKRPTTHGCNIYSIFPHLFSAGCTEDERGVKISNAETG